MRTLFKIAAWTSVALGVVLGGLYAFFFDVWTLPVDDPMMSVSVEPTVSAGDVLVVTRGSSIDYGELVRCADPQAPGRFVVARAMAHAGESLDIENELVAVDRRRNPSPHACKEVQRTLRDPRYGVDVNLVCSVEDFGAVEFDALRSANETVPATHVTVEPGRWFLVSDDRHLHVDSRDYGSVESKTCQHILFRIVSARGLRDSDARFSIIW
ncbi:MAG TPA: S26 family signal peptidase [Polyangiaceae bacterium]|jgi:signal peptidase I|nr:S26 family signal peptidase [Polyangiaceae bacterium]